METFLSPNTWIAGIVGAIVALILNPFSLKRAIRRVQGHLRHSKGLVRVWYWGRVKTKLLRIRKVNSDSLLVNRDISRCGVYLSLFLVSVLLWVPLTLVFFYLIPEARSWPRLTIWLGTPPIYFFEILWVIKSKFLDDLFKYREKLHLSALRLEMGKAGQPSCAATLSTGTVKLI